MKQIKFILFVCLSATILSCSDAGSENYALTNDNIAGVYNMDNFSAEIIANTVISGLPISVNSNSVGDTFQVDFIVNTDGTYGISGQYRIVTTVTSAGTTSDPESEIVTLDDSGGYTINRADNTISFTSLNEELLNGSFKVKSFGANSFTLTQDTEEVEANITASIKATLGFVRK